MVQVYIDQRNFLDIPIHNTALHLLNNEDKKLSLEQLLLHFLVINLFWYNTL